MDSTSASPSSSYWIDDGHEQAGRDVLLLFRRVFKVVDSAAWTEFKISADSMFRLWLNGSPLGRGPERSSVRHRCFDTYDLSELVRVGEENVIAVEVLCWGTAGPTYDISAQPALMIDAPQLSSDDEFRVSRNQVFNPNGAPEFPRVVHVAGNWMEYRDARGEGTDWRSLAFDDSDWAKARTIVKASDPNSPWRLFPRALPNSEIRPAEELKVIQFGIVSEAAASAPFGYAIQPLGEHTEAPFEFPADGQVYYLIVDAGRIVTAYLELELRAPAGAEVELMYAEAPRLNFVKGRRDRLDGQRIEGYTDVYLTREGQQTIEPLTRRTFRFIRIAIRSSEVLAVDSIRSRWTGYPLVQRGEFKCSDETLNQIWQVGWETCRLCAHDTYEDTPHYEQLQYTGDSRIQALISFVVGGEWRLAAKALAQLAETHRAGRFLQSRYPSRESQVIPGYSLLWIEMLEEFQLYTGHDDVALELVPVMDELLSLFRTHEDGLGCLRELPMWNFLDWTYPDKGVPHLAGDICTPITIFYVGALSAAGRLHRRLGHEQAADEYEARSERIARAVHSQTFSAKDDLYRDGVVRRGFSKHSSALAILYGLVEGAAADRVAEKIFIDERLRPTSFYFDFYVHRALEKIGRTDLLFADLSRWKDMLDVGATAWFELSDGERSDCHAWSSSPTLHLLTTVLGVRPTMPGFREVRIEPHTEGLEWASGRVATPHGEIEVAWHKRGGVHIDVKLPVGVAATVVYPDGREEPL
ncbi:MAG: alpha-L-rhamnosidase [Planctomycetota bacterium]